MKKSLATLRLTAVLSAFLFTPACTTDSMSGDGDELEVLDGDDAPFETGKDDLGPKKLPSFEKIWDNYPQGTNEEVKDLIGGAVDASWIVNTCTIRVSRALNYAGYKIPYGVTGLNTVAGADKKRYAFRVAELRRYLRTVLGAPTVSIKPDPTTGVLDLTPLQGKKGLIMFEVHGWSDATGHFDLWNGSEVAHNDHFDIASLVQLWVAPD